VAPLRGDFGLPEARVLAPGQPFRSTLHYRTAKEGSGRMPHLGSIRIDPEGVELLYQWIRQMPAPVEIHQQAARFDSWSAASPSAMGTGFDSMEEAQFLARAIRQHQTSPEECETILAGAAVQPPLVRELFPLDDPLAAEGKPMSLEGLLKRDGVIEKGRAWLFGEKGAICLTCHEVGGKGRDFGPSLDAIGGRLSKAQLIESILDPSAVVEASYAAQLVELKEGGSLMGFLVSRDDDVILLKDAGLNLHELSPSAVKSISPQKVSLMPAGLIQSMTEEEMADLVAFLQSLR
ncbi:MAG: hypothetical protein AAF514_10105, partial [Verrucomicrobiota bacterium]